MYRNLNSCDVSAPLRLCVESALSSRLGGLSSLGVTMRRPARCRDGGPVTIEVTPELRDRIRSAFPALAGETVFLENAGGS